MQNPAYKVLIVDDDPQQLHLLAGILSSQGDYTVQTAQDGVEGLHHATSSTPDVILTDLSMPRMDGFEFIRELRRLELPPPVIALTGFGSVDKAVSVVHELKAFWFLEKPVAANVLIPLIERAIAHRHWIRETDRLNRELALKGVLGSLIGRSAAMQEVFSLIRQVAPSPAAVFITGESGTGKELVAREIHRLSPRAAAPFIAINSAALPETLIESELFGHEKGAFTGAVERRAGCFEQSHGGTLLLDEIGEMPIQTQAKLLRVLEDMKVRRLGARTEFQVDSRIIAATNREPEGAVTKGQLRSDLFYRLNVFRIPLPPLRERKEDIAPIAEAMLHKLNQRHGTSVTDLAPSAVDRLTSYDWPGNVRELRNVIERALILAKEGPVRAEHVLMDHSASASKPATGPVIRQEGILLPPGLPLSEVEIAYLQYALSRNNGNRRAAAAELGISLRTLQTRLVELRGRAATGSK